MGALLPGMHDKNVTLDKQRAELTFTDASTKEGTLAGTCHLCTDLIVGTVDQVVENFREKLTRAYNLASGADEMYPDDNAEKQLLRTLHNQLQNTLGLAEPYGHALTTCVPTDSRLIRRRELRDELNKPCEPVAGSAAAAWAAAKAAADVNGYQLVRTSDREVLNECYVVFAYKHHKDEEFSEIRTPLRYSSGFTLGEVKNTLRVDTAAIYDELALTTQMARDSIQREAMGR